MTLLEVINLIAFLTVAGYAVYLFAHVVYSRYTFIRLGKPANLKKDLQNRLNEVWVNAPLPLQSPSAQIPGTFVRSSSSTMM